jgi:hypothetical protein
MIDSILESRDEQTELLWQLVANSTHGDNGARNAPAPAPITYSDFTATNPINCYGKSNKQFKIKLNIISKI